MIQLDTIYDILLTNHEDEMVSCLRDGEEVFQLSFKQFSKELKEETGCCDLTAKAKWELLEAKHIIVPYGRKFGSAHLFVRDFLTASKFYEKNKKIKIKISENAGGLA